MSVELALQIYLGVTVVLALATCAYDGWRGWDDPAGGVVLAFIWPAFLAAAAIFLPFKAAYKLGELLRALATSETAGGTE